MSRHNVFTRTLPLNHPNSLKNNGEKVQIHTQTVHVGCHSAPSGRFAARVSLQRRAAATVGSSRRACVSARERHESIEPKTKPTETNTKTANRTKRAHQIHMYRVRAVAADRPACAAPRGSVATERKQAENARGDDGTRVAARRRRRAPRN